MSRVQTVLAGGLCAAVFSMVGCGESSAPLASTGQDESVNRTAKLTVSQTQAGGSPYRPAPIGALERYTPVSGLTVSAESVRGAPDRVAEFFFSHGKIGVDGVVEISGSVTPIEPGTVISSLRWDWGDGSSDVGDLPISHEFPNAETYSVTVTATNNQGDSQRTTLNLTVPPMFPDANLEAAVRERIDKPTGKIARADVIGLTGFTAQNRGIQSIEGVQYMAGLFTINMDDNQIDDLTPLAGHPNLQFVNFSQNQLSGEDLVPVATMPNLRGVLMNNNQIDDISALAGLTSLEQLSLGSNGLGDAAMTTVGSLTGLVYLQMIFNQISDISPVANLTSLERFEMQGNQIGDISAIAGLTALTGVRLDNNPISDISALAGLTALEEAELDNCQISDISALENLTQLQLLFLHTNQISDLTPLINNSGIGEGDRILLGRNSLSEEATSTQIPALEARGATIELDKFDS